MIRMAGAITAFALMTACADGDAPRAVDSARVSDSVNTDAANRTVDSTSIPAPRAAFPDSVPPPVNTSGNLAGETSKPGGTMGQRNPPEDSIIGRDSAYGPIGTMDSKGRIKPIPQPKR